MSLKKIGQLINLPKLKMPNALTTGQAITSTKEIKPYITRDCEIIIEAIKYLKKKLKEDGVNTKRLITINQIAISYVMKKLLEQPEEIKDKIFWNKKQDKH